MNAVLKEVDETVKLEPEPEEERDLSDWLRDAQNAWRAHETWYNASTRTKLDQSLSHFHGTHAAGSKYHSEGYMKRSKLFHPKTRALVRRQEAAAAMAFFATNDVVNCLPPNDSDPKQRADADIQQALLNYRLNNSVPWFTTLLAAMQDCSIQGVVISCQSWRYREGQDKAGNSKRIEDRPDIRLIPRENIAFDPGCDWLDIVGSSPYLIEKIPMYIDDVMAMVTKGRQEGTLVPYLDDVTEEMLREHVGTRDTSATRTQREDGKGDRYDTTYQASGFGTIWVHRNYVRKDGVDWYYETINTVRMLSEPIEAWKVTGVEFRPYAIGTTMVESHRPVPESQINVIADLQIGLNETVNQRQDNVRLALNKRHVVRRGQAVDLKALMRSVPGGVIMANDPERDVKELKVEDVTSSAYQEQDRLNMEMDEIIGSFTGTTVGSQRALGETLGSQLLFSEGANTLTELGLRTLAETWVEPVLRQITELERSWESDEVILGVIGSMHDVDPMEVFRTLQEGTPVRATVSVGFGSTSPHKRIERLSMGLTTMASINPEMAMKADFAEVAKEVFGALGFKDGLRFYPHLADKEVDPQIQQLEEQIAQLQQQVEGKQMEFQNRLEIAQINAQSKLEIETIRQASAKEMKILQLRVDGYIAEQKLRLSKLDMQIKGEQNEIAKRELWMQREALSHSIIMAEREWELKSGQMTPPVAGGVDSEAEVQKLAAALQNPSSGTPIEAQPMNLPGDDSAGVIARGDFGLTPGQDG